MIDEYLDLRERGITPQGDERTSSVRHTLTQANMAIQCVAMAPRQRAEMVNVRMSAEEIAMLKELADDAGLSASDIVRTLIRDAHKKLESKKKR